MTDIELAIIEDMKKLEPPKYPRICQFCDKMFEALEPDEYTCDDCCAKFTKRCTKSDFITTDWTTKANRQIWAKRAKLSSDRLMKKCEGIHYGKKA